MGIGVKSNFDWKETNRKLVIFIPNYGRGKLAEFSIKNIKTNIPREDWVIIIGNDNIEENFDHLFDDNVRYFTLFAGNSKQRNGCFIRNYALSRCQSENMLQKDPEVVITGDFIKSVIDRNVGWRPGNIIRVGSRLINDEILKNGVSYLDSFIKSRVQQEVPTDRILLQELAWIDRQIYDCKYGDEPELNAESFAATWNNLISVVKMDGRPLVDAQFVWNKIKNGQGVQNVSSYFNYAYSINTDFLRSIGGYDESYCDYGYEDSDMFCRLMSAKYQIFPDYDCTAIHLWHETPNVSRLDEMHKVFISKNCDAIIRNTNGWGNGI
jgi:hypothetical protein